jgi:2-polyprenyl-3-methyl-5-hydroxy-6-metoxy-1,4-benzoquinol methylase
MNETTMIQQLPFSYEGIAGDVRQLGFLLKDSFAAVGMRLHGKISVLNVACGRADETGVLVQALAPAEVGFYLGIDLMGDAIQEATRRWKSKTCEIHFMEGNAAMLGRMKTLPEFDLVFLRHQNYWHEPMVWEGILDEAISAMKPDGYLACTSYFDLEHDLFVASMRQREVNPVLNVRNHQSRELPDAAGKSVDRWLGIWSKQKPSNLLIHA